MHGDVHLFVKNWNCQFRVEWSTGGVESAPPGKDRVINVVGSDFSAVAAAHWFQQEELPKTIDLDLISTVTRKSLDYRHDYDSSTVYAVMEWRSDNQMVSVILPPNTCSDVLVRW